MLKTWLLLIAVCLPAFCEDPKPIIDNERVTVWDLSWKKEKPIRIRPHQRDFLTIYLAGDAQRKGEAVLAQKGESRLKAGERAIVIEFKDHKVAPVPNNTGFPLAFPRPHVKKVLDNNHITVWSYAWTPGEPAPMHFHDKEVVVVYMEDIALRSTTPEGKVTESEHPAFEVKFNLGNRRHTEILMKGTGSAMMTELK